MIQILENIYAVNVPSESKQYKHFAKILWWSNLGHDWNAIRPLKDSYSVLGTATPTEIDFNVEPYVYQSKERRSVGIPFYKNYNGNEWLIFSHESFRSALTAAGITEYEKLIIIQKT